VKDETLFRRAQAEILTQVVEICGQLRYQLDHRGAQKMALTYTVPKQKIEAKHASVV